MNIVRLKPEQLRRRCDPKLLEFDTTDQLEGLEEFLGQGRALEALRFGVGIRGHDFNIYALGPNGIGKHSVVKRLLEECASAASVPSDFCYVHNFDEPNSPVALPLPAGRGPEFRHDMEQLIDELRAAIPSAFESEEFRTRKQAIEQESERVHEQELRKLQQRAAERKITLVRTPVGVALAPVRDQEALSPEEFEKLPEEDQQRIKKNLEELQQELEAIVRQVPQWVRERRAKVKELVQEVAFYSAGTLLDELRLKYGELDAVLAHLERVQKHIVEHVDEFISKETESELVLKPPAQEQDEPPKFWRYRVNLIADHSLSQGAPVIYEDHPTYENLVGRIEHLSRFGTLFTDFSLIKPGALHRANGGYLLLDARKVLMQPYAWDGLKRALQAREVRIEPLSRILGLFSTKSLEPRPVPLSVKVVLMGSRRLYYLLNALDPEFSELFQIAADFGEDIDWTPENIPLYARMIAQMVKSEGLRPFDRSALALVIEHGARQVDDASKLSVHRRDLRDLLREANYLSERDRDAPVTGRDVQAAIDQRTRRSDRIRERIYEQIRRGTLMIDMTGTKVGQVNGLSVLELPGFRFARPSRITARSSLGKGTFLDIEREVELGGPIHSKGVLILQGFLTARYSSDRPLAVSASLVFEQSYGGVEGDSASSAELYALLSSLSGLPIKQSLAVTGSINQHGEVQAIGGVNEKIEGFFDVCRETGLDGEQGVLIPKSNVQHLMLREEVIEAVDAGRFHVYAVSSVDEGMEILTGARAGERGEDGRFPDGTINALVERRLVELSETARRFAESSGRQP